MRNVVGTAGCNSSRPRVVAVSGPGGSTVTLRMCLAQDGHAVTFERCAQVSLGPAFVVNDRSTILVTVSAPV
jgi:hypothetical protein